MSTFLHCHLPLLILYCLTVDATEDVLRASRERMKSLEQRLDRLEQQSENLRQALRQKSDVAVSPASRLVSSNSRNWTLRHLPSLCQKKRLFVSGVFALRQEQSRLPNDLIQTVIEQWTPLPPDMLMDEMIQCRDLRHESFLSLKCAQEIKRRLSLCNQDQEERMTLYNNTDHSTRKMYRIHYFDRASNEIRFAMVNAPKMIADAQTMSKWYKGCVSFTKGKWIEPLDAHLLGQTDLSKPCDFMMLQSNFINEADGSVTLTIGWYPDKVEVRDIIAVREG